MKIIAKLILSSFTLPVGKKYTDCELFTFKESNRYLICERKRANARVEVLIN